MAGPAQVPQPYGHAGQPIPQYGPVSPRQKGSTAPKVWGIILLVLGGLGLLSVVVSLATLASGGISGSTFAPGISPAMKAEMDRIAEEMVNSMKGRWSFWATQAFELIIVGLSLAAGFLMAIRPRPVGRKLAIARGLVVLLTLPIAGYEGLTQMEEQMELQARLQRVQMEEISAKHGPANSARREEQRREVEETMESVQPIMKGVSMGMLVLTSVGVIVINALLIFFMTRPTVREYMEGVRNMAAEPIPNYDPSMGLALGPPPGTAPQPPVPPEQPPV